MEEVGPLFDEREISEMIGDLWQVHIEERYVLDRISDYAKGLRGAPEVPDGSGQEVKDLAKLSVKNVLGMIVEAFAKNLSVSGYRTAAAQDNDPAWALWQRNRMDARQAFVHVPALTFGAAYVTVTATPDGPVLNPRSPKQILTAYDDPVSGEWPQYAFEMWVTQEDAKLRRRGRFYDDTFVYQLDLGAVTSLDPLNRSATEPITVRQVDDPVPHGGSVGGMPVCPVVRFVNARDADGQIVGEVAPLIRDQQALNQISFDRLIISRFGAFPQKVISGWSGSAQEVLRASAMRVWAFEDPEVRASTLQAASSADQNAIIEEMMQHIALKAGVSLANVMGKLVNIPAEAYAAAESNQQRKLALKRESFGESWEQVLRLAAGMDNDSATSQDSGAEVVWRDTEARSFAATVDAITKLAGAGVPIEQLLTLVPGMTQQQVTGIKSAIRGGQTAGLVDKLLATPAPAVPAVVGPPPIDRVLAEVNPDAAASGS